MEKAMYKRLNYLKKMRKKLGLSSDIYLTNPYIPITYGRKNIELMPDAKDRDVILHLNLCFKARIVAYNYMYDILNSQFKDAYTLIPTYYYKKIFNNLIDTCIFHDELNELSPDLYNFIWDNRVPNDIILYAFATAQSLYHECGSYSKKTSYDSRTILMSASRILSYDKNTVYIEPFGAIETSEVKTRLYKNRNIIKIYLDEYGQYYLKLGKRMYENGNIDKSSVEEVYRDPVTGIIVEKHKVIEF